MLNVTEADAIDLLDTMVTVRYPGHDAIDFLAAFSDGLADSMFPGSRDLQVLAEAIEDL